MKSIGRGRPWFQFTLRALFGLTLVTCICGAWFARERQLARDQLAAAESIRQIGGTAMFCHNYASDDEEPSFRNWLRSTLVKDATTNVNYVSVRGNAVADQEIACLRSLPDLKSLTITRSRVTDEGMEALESLPLLESLSLEGANISDRSLACLSGLTRLERLNLSGTGVTDSGLESLATLAQLRELSLEHTDITDAGLVHLRSLARLRRLNLRGTRVTEDGAARLYKFLPEVAVSL